MVHNSPMYDTPPIMEYEQTLIFTRARGSVRSVPCLMYVMMSEIQEGYDIYDIIITSRVLMLGLLRVYWM